MREHGHVENNIGNGEEQRLEKMLRRREKLAEVWAALEGKKEKREWVSLDPCRQKGQLGTSMPVSEKTKTLKSQNSRKNSSKTL